jgi:hypothetical protein
MSVRQVWTCDRCRIDEPSKDGGGLPIGWTRADVRFHDLPKMNHGQHIRILDLCEPCQDDLKRVWDHWLDGGVTDCTDSVTEPAEAVSGGKYHSASPWPQGSVACAAMGEQLWQESLARNRR